MLFTVQETAEALEIDSMSVYYLIKMSYLDAFKVCNRWKVDEESVGAYDRRKSKEGIGREVCGRYGHGGCDERIAYLKEKRLQVDSRQGDSCVEGRGRWMELSSIGRSGVFRKKRKCLKGDDLYQLLLFDD